MSLAIFIRAQAKARNEAWDTTMASQELCAANLFGAVMKGNPVSLAISAAWQYQIP